MSFKSSIGDLEDAGSSWLGFFILILIWIQSLVFGTTTIQILALYLHFEDAKNIHVLYVLIWGFGGRWRFLTGDWHPNFDLEMVNVVWNTHFLNFGSISWFWSCKKHPCPLSPQLGIWMTLKVPDWCLASWSWFGYGHCSLIQPWSKFWLSIFILKMQRTSMSFMSWFGVLEDAGGPWMGFGILILIWIWSMVFDIPIFRILALSWF